MDVLRIEPFVDIHCHLLPGLDDGAATQEQALAMARMAVADGIGTIVATPHQLGKHAKNSGPLIREATSRFQQVLNSHRVPLRVLPGGDVRIDPDLPGKIRACQVLTLADRHRHVLLELPHDVYLPLNRLLSDLAADGIVGILSHPERNRGILDRPSLLHSLVETGCLLQVTAGSLTGDFGAASQALSEWMIQQRLVHFVSTDAHGTGSRPPQLRAAYNRIRELAGQQRATSLCSRNPAAVANGEKVSMRGEKQENSTRAGWFCWPFASGRVSA